MAKALGPRKVHHYTKEFKVQAVRLSLSPDFETQDVAHALDIHPFMLSRWKKEYREGRLKAGTAVPALSLPQLPKANGQVQALQRKVRSLERKVEAQTKVRALERKLRALEVENDLLKKAIRYNLERRKRSSSS
jgi:transposase